MMFVASIYWFNYLLVKNGYLFLFILLTGLSFPAKAALDVVSMKCEYLEDPMGIDMPDPRFYWQLSSDEEGIECFGLSGEPE